ncbi:hypothetical protein NLX85_06140 [Micromonospora sp. A3M-1-15]|uniref:hypothetical protein n=1 Tax=Micromonospora sp. A3M-1-15 TaxID=2962035 RepID=UPI0020B67E67|nr:hypothetical protein [Micromonospora sp. A3M-1-15]MCP3782944.1 hypothetical protein [Micromonospora sp. A3M-1-15]
MDHLGEAVATLDQGGVLTPLADLVRQVYRRAADRHEPELGDDAMSFGTTVWRNLTNLGAAQFAGLPGVDARIEDNSLEILCAGYIVRLYSLQGGTGASVESIRWEGSEARLGGAVENSRSGQLALDDEEQFPEAFTGVVPRRRHVRVAHAGDLDTGEAVAYLGLPRDNRDGGSPWFEVQLWIGQPAHPVLTASGSPAAPGPVLPGEVPIPELDVLVRSKRRGDGVPLSALA